MSRFSKSVMTSLNEIPSGGRLICGIEKFGAFRTWSGMRSAPMVGPEQSTTARSITFSSSRTLPAQSYSISRSSASGITSRPTLRFSSPYLSRKWWTRSGMSSLRSRSGGS